jgi:ankyrin repeat protein
VNAVDEYKDTPLHEAASLGCLAVVKLLAKNGARIDVRNNEGKTPLDYCRSGYGAAAEIRRVLEEAGTHSN